ncbi:MAG: peroxidase family protein [Pseudomonadota bacterium]
MIAPRTKQHASGLPPTLSATALTFVLGVWAVPQGLAQPARNAETAGPAVEEQAEALLREADERGSESSPVRRLRREQQGDGRGNRRGDGDGLTTNRLAPSIDGRNNNRANPASNASHTALARLAPAAYTDGISTPAGLDRPSARLISNQVSAQAEERPNTLRLSSFLWQWGQFLDHDLDLTDGADPAEALNVDVPRGDPWFDPAATGAIEILLNRSLYDTETGTSADNPREQINEITGWIDGSNVYGSDLERAQALRELDDSGRLRVSAGNLLPFNVDGLANAGGESSELFLAGDPRANEQIGLAAMHTLFVREHNRQVARLAAANPRLTGDELYAQARRMVIGLLQVITYEEFLPALLGPGALDDYRGYNPRVDARIVNEFSTASYRMGHTLLPPILLRLNRAMNESSFGHLSLADAFFSPARLTDEGGIEPLLRGMSRQLSQDFDVYVVDEVRNFLFGLPGSGGFDLVSLNIQRGRDHGLPDYNSLRQAMGLAPVRSLEAISSDPEVSRRLLATYNSPDQVDAWIGGLAEDALEGAMVGELVGAVIADQFERLRDGDRFWYTRILNREQRQEVEQTRLADVIRRNTTIGAELGDRDVFRVD